MNVLILQWWVIFFLYVPIYGIHIVKQMLWYLTLHIVADRKLDLVGTLRVQNTIKIKEKHQFLLKTDF
jgi:hypothetical protein